MDPLLVRLLAAAGVLAVGWFLWLSTRPVRRNRPPIVTLTVGQAGVWSIEPMSKDEKPK